MDEQEKWTELIDKYFSGNLTAEDQLLFDQKMLDPEFEKKVSLVNELVQGVRINAIEDIKASLQQEEAIIRKEKRVPLKWILSTAAAIALILISFWWLNRPSFITPDYYSQYFIPQKNTLVIEEKSIPKSDLKFEVFRNYDNKNYDVALSGFDQLLISDNNPDYKYYKANTLLALGKTDQAINILENLLLENKTQYSTESKWLLALSYLKQNNFNSAKPLLQELSSGFYKDKVNQILKDSRF